VTAPTPALAPDLHAGLRRLKLAAMRALAPELLVTAKTQRWAPEELLRTLVEAEICARDASNARHRLKAAAFPVAKTLEEFDVACSRVLSYVTRWRLTLSGARLTANDLTPMALPLDGSHVIGQAGQLRLHGLRRAGRPL
jgi:hypothetical protein